MHIDIQEELSSKYIEEKIISEFPQVFKSEELYAELLSTVDSFESDIIKYIERVSITLDESFEFFLEDHKTIAKTIILSFKESYDGVDLKITECSKVGDYKNPDFLLDVNLMCKDSLLGHKDFLAFRQKMNAFLIKIKNLEEVDLKYKNAKEKVRDLEKFIESHASSPDIVQNNKDKIQKKLKTIKNIEQEFINVQEGSPEINGDTTTYILALESHLKGIQERKINYEFSVTDLVLLEKIKKKKILKSTVVGGIVCGAIILSTLYYNYLKREELRDLKSFFGSHFVKEYFYPEAYKRLVKLTSASDLEDEFKSKRDIDHGKVSTTIEREFFNKSSVLVITDPEWDYVVLQYKDNFKKRIDHFFSGSVSKFSYAATDVSNSNNYHLINLDKTSEKIPYSFLCKGQFSTTVSIKFTLQLSYEVGLVLNLKDTKLHKIQKSLIASGLCNNKVRK